MLLRIVDKPDASQENAKVEILLEREGKETLRYSEEYVQSLPSPALKADVRWYLDTFQKQTPTPEQDKNVINRMLNVGSQIGDRLLVTFSIGTLKKLIELLTKHYC